MFVFTFSHARRHMCVYVCVGIIIQFQLITTGTLETSTDGYTDRHTHTHTHTQTCLCTENQHRHNLGGDQMCWKDRGGGQLTIETDNSLKAYTDRGEKAAIP